MLQGRQTGSHFGNSAGVEFRHDNTLANVESRGYDLHGVDPAAGVAPGPWAATFSTFGSAQEPVTA